MTQKSKSNKAVLRTLGDTLTSMIENRYVGVCSLMHYSSDSRGRTEAFFMVESAQAVPFLRKVDDSLPRDANYSLHDLDTGEVIRERDQGIVIGLNELKSVNRIAENGYGLN